MTYLYIELCINEHPSHTKYELMCCSTVESLAMHCENILTIENQ